MRKSFLFDAESRFAVETATYPSNGIYQPDAKGQAAFAFLDNTASKASFSEVISLINGVIKHL